jgi:hypothetical protein
MSVHTRAQWMVVVVALLIIFGIAALAIVAAEELVKHGWLTLSLRPVYAGSMATPTACARQSSICTRQTRPRRCSGMGTIRREAGTPASPGSRTSTSRRRE